MSRIVDYPLSSSFMAISIIGFFVSIWFVADLSEQWSFTFAFFFVVMFIASMISMSRSEPVRKHMNELAIHETERKIKADIAPYESIKPKKFVPKWFDGLFVVFIVLATYYLVEAVINPYATVSPFLFIVVLTLYVIFMIWFIVDAISKEIAPIYQIVFVLILLALGPLGMFIYYFYRRTS